MLNEREIVLDMLVEILEKKGYSHLVIRSVLDKYNYADTKSKAFIKRVCEGTIERLITIDYILDCFSKTPVKKMKPLIRNLLRMSVYQIIYMDYVPDSAACNEAVKLAGKRGFRTLQGFVNGVLRTISRNKEQIPYPKKEQDRIRYYSVQYSMPEWLVEHFLSGYGETQTIQMLEDIQRIHPVTVRYCKTEECQREWLARLKKQQISVQQHPYEEQAFLLEETENIRELPGYCEGEFAVQDVSSMLVTKAASLNGDEFVLDVCAAPGGKALHAAGSLSEGHVLARDLTEYKVAQIIENRERLQLLNLEAEVYDAGVLDENMIQKADVVYADLPCSGLGIMGKKRDIRYRISPEQMQELVKLQREILSVVWQYVKPGGILIYSTCTIHKEENEHMVEWFEEQFPFQRESLAPYLPEELQKQGKEGMLQLLPGIHQCDGFFLARLRRKE